MKRHNRSINHLNNEDTELGTKKLISELDKLDNIYPVKTPNIEWFQQVVLVEKKQLRRKFIRELALFLIVALTLLSTYLVAFHHFPLVVFVIQIVLTILPIIVLTKKRERIADETDIH